jgi:hypothetical protein
LNFRGQRTKYALAVSAVGIYLIMYAVIFGGGENLYYPGVSIVFLAVWLNGSLLYFLGKLKNALFAVWSAAKGKIPA